MNVEGIIGASQRQPQKFAAARDAVDCAAAQLLFEISWATSVLSHQSIFKHVYALDGRTSDVRREPSPDCFDLGKLRHGLLILK
jgi:hypothetical protein